MLMTEPSSKARKRQIIAGLISGAIMGIVISAFTQFWWWLPAGVIVGLVSGALIKPPDRS